MLFYDVVDQFTDRRAPHRAAHLALAKAAYERGELILAGALDGPAEGAALVFKAEDRAVAEQFAANDPYVREGLVTRWTVRKWTVVVGDDC